jgi:formylglycine-generating enzyme required for sulfatase activity
MKKMLVFASLGLAAVLGITGCITGGTREIEWCEVEAGTFTMGSEDEDAFVSEDPEHEVYLDAYSISKHEITNDQFCGFLNAIKKDLDVEITDIEYLYYVQVEREGDVIYASEGEEIDWKGGRFFVQEGFDDYPVVGATWYGAQAFCDHYGYRLPTEAEWEKAARGTDKRKYPWGNTEPGAKHANFDDNQDSRSKVGSYPKGASPYGCLDMAGNVEEWCADWFDDEYYSVSPDSNPQGPESGKTRVSRGGSYYQDARHIRCAYRHYHYPPGTFYGFRVCKN